MAAGPFSPNINPQPNFIQIGWKRQKLKTFTIDQFWSVQLVGQKMVLTSTMCLFTTSLIFFFSILFSLTEVILGLPYNDWEKIGHYPRFFSCWKKWGFWFLLKEVCESSAILWSLRRACYHLKMCFSSDLGEDIT